MCFFVNVFVLVLLHKFVDLSPVSLDNPGTNGNPNALTLAKFSLCACLVSIRIWSREVKLV